MQRSIFFVFLFVGICLPAYAQTENYSKQIQNSESGGSMELYAFTISNYSPAGMSTEAELTAKSRNTYHYAIKANGLSYLMLTPQLEFEYYMKNPRWSATFSAQYGYIRWASSKGNTFRRWTISPELRYWFSPDARFNRWYTGVYFHAGEYNVLLGSSEGKQGSFWGGGISGGYVQPLMKNWALEYGMGLAFIHTRYSKYNFVDGKRMRTGFNIRNAFLPTKLQVSIIKRF